MKHPSIYIRGLRQVDHTVFCVSQGQKVYRDPATGRQLPYSSGQQVKRSIMDTLVGALGENRAPITFNFTLAGKDGKKVLSNDEPWSPCDPTYADQLIGGWMRAGKGSAPVKRRSPLSISAMRPLHPSLANIASEAVTFDRSDESEAHIARVVDEKGIELTREAVAEFLSETGRNLPMRLWIPEDKVGGRATGLFVFDVAIDLATLFSVSLYDYEPEISTEVKQKLLEAGWITSPDGLRLLCPPAKREAIIDALAEGLVEWRITSNQSRTLSLQNTLAIAISENANHIGTAIRADLTEQSDFQKAAAVLDTTAGATVYTAKTALAWIPGADATADALEAAKADLKARLLAYDYEA